MNDLAREKLIQAQMSGVKQIYLKLNYGDGRCALGALGFRSDQTKEECIALSKTYDLKSYNGFRRCEECGYPAVSEKSLITHLNDFHHYDFLTIARKMP